MPAPDFDNDPFPLMTPLIELVLAAFIVSAVLTATFPLIVIAFPVTLRLLKGKDCTSRDNAEMIALGSLLPEAAPYCKPLSVTFATVPVAVKA